MGKTSLTPVDGATSDTGAPPIPPMKRTPAFAATNGMRYRRQELIKEIELATSSQLICCIGGAATAIRRDDVLFLSDLLHNIRRGEPIDLMLHTPGGDMDAAEKLVSMISGAAGTAPFRIIVPDFAKSAGTLMALGSNSVLMSDSSELGPIDPQVVSEERNGMVHLTAIQNYLDAYAECSAALKKEPGDTTAQAMLDKFDPTRLHHYSAAIKRARSLAEKLLGARMFQAGSGNVTAIAGQLMNTKQYLSHGQMIGYVEAQELGLRVDYLSPEDPVWQAYWQLYCYQRLEVGERFKLFESQYASLREDDAV